MIATTKKKKEGGKRLFCLTFHLARNHLNVTDFEPLLPRREIAHLHENGLLLALGNKSHPSMRTK